MHDENDIPYDLSKYIDESQYLLVNKTQSGKAIQYVEKPGLWNGSMAKWLTKFIEVDSETFKPVKTILNLLS